MIGDLIELQTLEASDDRIWCVAWNPTGTLYGSICLLYKRHEFPLFLDLLHVVQTKRSNFGDAKVNIVKSILKSY